MKRLILVYLILITSLVAFTQQADSSLSVFLIVQQGEEVFLRWTIEAGNTCQGTRIERSDDGLSFEEVGEIPGVCGSPNQPISYEYTDEAPLLNRTNYYRLEMGALGYTSVVAVDFIILHKEGYSLQPNPVTSTSKLLYENPDNEDARICIFDSRGRQVMEYITREDHIYIDRNLLDSGNYIFKILINNSSRTVGKLVII